MFRCPASFAAHQSDAVTFNVEDSGRRVSSITTGLRAQCADWSSAYLVKRLLSVFNASARLIYTDSGDSTMSLMF